MVHKHELKGDEIDKIDLFVFMGLCQAEITKKDVENQINLDKKTKYQLIVAALLTSTVKLLSKPYIPSENLQNGLVSLYNNR